MNENNPFPFASASRKRRIAALLIDHFVMTFLIISIVFIALGPDFMDANSAGKMSATMLGVMLPGFFLYLAKDSIQGISLGKWVLGIMVRDESDPMVTPSFGRLLIRNLFLLIWPVEFIVLITNNRKMRLGDKTAKTIVVKNLRKPGKAQRMVTLLAIIVFLGSFTFLFISFSIKNSEAYKVSVKEIETDKKILLKTGGIKGFGMLPLGSITTTNGQGKAELEIKVLGKKKDLKIHVYLEKELGGEWKVVN